MQYLIKFMLLIVAIIHLLPVSGVISVDRLAYLYGISIENSSLEILMRHRAILFGILGLFLLWAVFKPSLQLLGFIAGFISVVSFLLLSLSVGDYNNELSHIIIADIIALVCLLIGLMAYMYDKHNKLTTT